MPLGDIPGICLPRFARVVGLCSNPRQTVLLCYP
jgi:hypothetical protein